MKKQERDSLLTEIRLSSLTRLLEYAVSTEYTELKEMYLSEAIDYLDDWKESIRPVEEAKDIYRRYDI